MNEDPGRLRKLVPVLRQRQMIVALDQALESRLHRIADHRQRTSPHLLGTVAALLAPLLEPQIDAGPANPETLGDTAGPLTFIARLQHTAAKVIGIGLGHAASPLNRPFLNPPNLHAFRFRRNSLPRRLSLTERHGRCWPYGSAVMIRPLGAPTARR